MTLFPKSIRGAFGALLLSVALPAAALAAPEGELTLAVGATAPQLHPQKTTLPPNISMNIMAHEGLFRLDGDSAILPELATEWGFSDDALTFWVKVKTDHVFSNGNPVDVPAIIGSLEELKSKDSGSIYTGLYQSLGEITAAGPDRIEFKLPSKNGHLLMLLANPAAAIVDTKAEAEMGAADFARGPIGSGPYMVEEFRAGERMSVVPNPKYKGDLPATLERVTFLTVPEDGSRMAMMETGEVDVVGQVPAESIPTLEDLDEVAVIAPPSMFSIGMEIKMDGAYKDHRVREALNISIDRDGMIQGILGGLGTSPTTQVGPGTQEGMRAEFGTIPFDPERAKALLAEAGVTPGSLSLVMHCPNGRYIKDAQVCQALAAQWQAIGIKAEARVYDLATWSAKNRLPWDQREDDMTMLGRATPGIDYTLLRLFKTGVTANTTGFSNEKVDALLDEGRQTLDVEEQKKIYAEVQKIVWDEMPFVFLWYPKQALGVKDSVVGLVVKPEETILFDKVHVTE